MVTGSIWRDGEMIDAEDATVHVLSHGMQRGSTVFDVLCIKTTSDGRRCAMGLREHVARFVRGMSLMSMENAPSAGVLERAVADVAAANPTASTIKLVAAWREVPLGALPLSLTPTVYVAGFEPEHPDAPAAPSPSQSVRTASAPKMPAELLPPSLKVAASYTVSVREKLAAAREGFDDVVYRGADGGLAEGSTQAIFVVNDGRLAVPPLDSVLDGITRRFVIDVAHHLGITVEVRPIAWSEVSEAEELFQCSTHHPVRPIHRHDDRDLTTPGVVSAKVAAEVCAIYAGDHPLSARWLTPVDVGAEVSR